MHLVKRLHDVVRIRYVVAFICDSRNGTRGAGRDLLQKKIVEWPHGLAAYCLINFSIDVVRFEKLPV